MPEGRPRLYPGDQVVAHMLDNFVHQGQGPARAVPTGRVAPVQLRARASGHHRQAMGRRDPEGSSDLFGVPVAGDHLGARPSTGHTTGRPGPGRAGSLEIRQDRHHAAVNHKASARSQSAQSIGTRQSGTRQSAIRRAPPALFPAGGGLLDGCVVARRRAGGWGRALPGLQMPAGSNAERNSCIVARSSGLNILPMAESLWRPTPCSPVIEPPWAIQSSRMSSDSSSARSSSPSLRSSNSTSGWRLPSPAWKTFATLMPDCSERAEMSCSTSGRALRGTTPSCTM